MLSVTLAARLKPLFVRQQLLQPGGLSLAMKVFQEIHSTGVALSKAQVARQNAKSDTVAPTQGELFLPEVFLSCGKQGFGKARMRGWAQTFSVHDASRSTKSGAH